MRFTRLISVFCTYPVRLLHRRGFGIHSPHDYELVRDVLYERLSYYAYQDLGLRTFSERQLYRLGLHYDKRLVCVCENASKTYDELIDNVNEDLALVIDGISSANYDLWNRILRDQRAKITFDMIDRGLVLFDAKRIKQNYLL